MIENVSGNLLLAAAEALVNTVNCVGVMGKGIALQFKQAFPANYDFYRRAAKNGEVRLGHMLVFDAGSVARPHYIINFPTKGHWRSKSRLADVRNGLRDLAKVIEQLGVKSIAVPPLGCGNGGLEWREVRAAILEALGDLEGVDVQVFQPTGAPNASEMRVATNKPRMTYGRASLVVLLGRYPGDLDGPTPIEAQKLMYFLQESGERLKLEFVPARYGPYAENLSHVLLGIEGHYVRGFGDRSKQVADAEPLVVVDGALEAAENVLEERYPATRVNVDRVLSLTEGFESPYGMELLATVHWVATKVGDSLVPPEGEVVNRIQAWSRRKARLFTERHINVAYERLLHQGWFSPQPEAPASGRLL